MNRRSFFSAFAGAPAVAAASTVATCPAPQPPRVMSVEDCLMLKEDKEPLDIYLPTGFWRFMWTGWRDLHDSDSYSGQWLACRLNEDSSLFERAFGLYVSVPGLWGPFGRGDVFAIGRRFPQILPSILDPSGKKEQKRHGAEAIVSLVRASGWGLPATSEGWYNVRAHLIDVAWEKIPSRIQFYLDADRWGEERHPEKMTPMQWCQGLHGRRMKGWVDRDFQCDMAERFGYLKPPKESVNG